MRNVIKPISVYSGIPIAFRCSNHEEKPTMKLKQTLLTLSILVATQAANAMIAPYYVQLRVFDAVVMAFSNVVKLEEDETIDDVEISSLEVLADGDIAIANDRTSCVFKIRTNPLPKGAVGVPGYSAMDEVCITDTEGKVAKTKSYEDISEKLRQAAKFQKMVKKVSITKKNTIKLSYK